MESKTAEDFLWGALIGGAIGAAAALMLTPMSGERLRKKIVSGLPYSNNHHDHVPHNVNRRSSDSHSQKKAHSKVQSKPVQTSRRAKPKPKHGQ